MKYASIFNRNAVAPRGAGAALQRSGCGAKAERKRSGADADELQPLGRARTRLLREAQQISLPAVKRGARPKAEPWGGGGERGSRRKRLQGAK